jgi:hypothetical protein
VTEAHLNVRPLRPMRIALVTDDARYGSELLAAAARLGTSATVLGTAEDLESRVEALAWNVVVFDADTSLARTTRKATAFAALHPRISVGLLVRDDVDRSAGSVRLFDKWRSADRLLGELERVHVGLRD